MSTQQSNLSSAKYGYDVVVATSQFSINNTLLQILYDKSSVAPNGNRISCHGRPGNYYQMDQATVLAQTGNIDPFSVPAWNGSGAMPSGVTAFTTH